MHVVAHTTSYLAATVLCLASASNVHAESTARIVETQPAETANLGRQESFWVRIEYNSDEPISLWARPYLNGAQVQKVFSNGSSRYTGSGEALGWFALTAPGEVDEVRIVAGGGHPYREWELARKAVQLTWTNVIPSGAAPTPWVADLLAAEKVRQMEEAKQRASEPTSAGQVVFFSGFMLMVFALLAAGLIVPLWSVWKWRGAWRLAALVPVAIMLLVTLRIIVGIAHDSTSHNLWPFEILEFGIPALAITGALALARHFAIGRSSP
jgi:hypothetical protein